MKPYYFSAEVRWFFPGTVQDGDALHSWFVRPLKNYGRSPEELRVFESDNSKQPRIDEYLVLPETTTVGPKLRGGDTQSSFEIKAQASPPAPWRLGDRVSGRTDAWTKWSFKHEALNQALGPLRQEGKWILIAKDRWLRKISMDSGSPVFVVPDAKAYRLDHADPALRQMPDVGCNFELTRIFIGNDRSDPAQAWTTICFEAFAPDLERARATLEPCAKLSFDELGLPPGVELTEDSSLSYPAWFLTLQRAPAPA